MLKAVEAVIDKNGTVRLLEKVNLIKSHRAIVTILDENAIQQGSDVSETALLSEQALAEDWNRPEEDEAWSHLQQGR
jgi:hypothetical protein